MTQSSKDPDPKVVRSNVQARQAVTGHNVRYVLYWGTAAVTIGMALIWFYYFG